MATYNQKRFGSKETDVHNEIITNSDMINQEIRECARQVWSLVVDYYVYELQSLYVIDDLIIGVAIVSILWSGRDDLVINAILWSE